MHFFVSISKPDRPTVTLINAPSGQPRVFQAFGMGSGDDVPVDGTNKRGLWCTRIFLVALTITSDPPTMKFSTNNTARSFDGTNGSRSWPITLPTQPFQLPRS